MTAKRRREPRQPDAAQLIKSGELLELLGGIGKKTLAYYLEELGFPDPISTGKGKRPHRQWLLSEVREWVARLPKRKAKKGEK